ncbi:hypothetical protein V8E52_009642 [Russula decolorans]
MPNNHPNVRTIRIPQRWACSLCQQLLVTTPPDENGRHRCLVCKKSERCSSCHAIRRQKHFRNANRPDSPFKTCAKCREKAMLRTNRLRTRAAAAGERWCSSGHHQVSVAACTVPILTFVALSRVKELNNLIFIGTLDYSRVKKLGGKQLQLRRQDRARRYHE